MKLLVPTLALVSALSFAPYAAAKANDHGNATVHANATARGNPTPTPTPAATPTPTPTPPPTPRAPPAPRLLTRAPIASRSRSTLGATAGLTYNLSRHYQHESNADGEFNASANQILASVGVSLFPWRTK